MDIDWGKIRAIGGSQQHGFEELCCQVAARECTEAGLEFIRVKAPDGGVEGFATREDGRELGWQAKFFLRAPGSVQWKQVDKSVRSALDAHPALAVYTICFPRDRECPKDDKKKWFMKAWKKHVDKWTQWSEARGQHVEFTYWGQHEILSRLVRADSRGFWLWWFDHEFLATDWFRSRLREAIEDEGVRYSPELNVELPIAQAFEALGRTRAFESTLAGLIGDVQGASGRAASIAAVKVAGTEYSALRDALQDLGPVLEIQESACWEIPWDDMLPLLHGVLEAAQSCREAISKNVRAKQVQQMNLHVPEQVLDLEFELRRLIDLQRKIFRLREMATSEHAVLANGRSLLVVGDTGTGKTHLFCDVAERRASCGLQSVLLAGRKFWRGDPRSEIGDLLDTQCGWNDLLDALNAAGEACGQRVLILIDALNESRDEEKWADYLGGMLAGLSSRPWVVAAFSVRSTYEDLVVPDGLTPGKLVRLVHCGFFGHEYEASEKFFSSYGLELPSIPVLVPEFQNPQFLRLFCQALHDGGHERIPPGLSGVTAIYDFFIRTVNDRVCAPGACNLDASAGPVGAALQALAAEMAQRRVRWLPRDEAKDIVDESPGDRGFSHTLFRALVDEGLLAEDRFAAAIPDDGSGPTWQHGVRFAFERLADHMIARNVLDTHLSGSPEKALADGRALRWLIPEDGKYPLGLGVVEALAVQLPERTSMELFDVAPWLDDDPWGTRAFISSLVWRDPSSVTSKTLSLVRGTLCGSTEQRDQLFRALLNLSLHEGHPLNAEYLHGLLHDLSLADRDAMWSTFLHRQWEDEETSPVARLLRWLAGAMDAERKVGCGTARLAGITLAWCLTSSNRFLRDTVTKALVDLMVVRADVLCELLVMLHPVNDPYVVERLHAVAYGVAMRGSGDDSLERLARCVYALVFASDPVPAHVLLRDYARGVVEAALARALTSDLDYDRARPPYGSAWPDAVPTEDELAPLKHYREGMPDEEVAALHLYESVMGWGDFARYVIGTNSGFFPWTSRRLGAAKQPDVAQIHREFMESLTERQAASFASYESLLKMLPWRRTILLAGTSEAVENLSEAARREAVGALERALLAKKTTFLRTLGKKKRAAFTDQVLPALEEPRVPRDRFDLAILQRWILGRVLELGWSVERFGRFDRDVQLGDGRQAHKAERIGKKYQWIAYHEILARVADNFTMDDSLFRASPQTDYEGPWQLGCRDIDPSFSPRSTRAEGLEPNPEAWWIPHTHSAWGDTQDDGAWVRASEDLPDPRRLLIVEGAGDGITWVNLHLHVSWAESSSSVLGRRLWYAADAYLIKDADFAEALGALENRSFRRNEVPEARGLGGLFLGEPCWSPCYEWQRRLFQNYSEWIRPGAHVDVEPAVAAYYWESGLDCSLDDSVLVHIPSCDLATGMGLRWVGAAGQYCSADGRVLALDPSIRSPGPSSLLVRLEALRSFLADSSQRLMWALRGEKNVCSRDDTNRPGWLRIGGTYYLSSDGRVIGKHSTIHSDER